MFSSEICHTFQEYALSVYPNEACAVVLEVEGEYCVKTCANSANNQNIDFLISPRELTRCKNLGAIVAILHSHTNDRNYPSKADMIQQHATALPWGICSVTKDGYHPMFWFGKQVPIPPLVGRQFRHGVTDCYAAIRDWYQLEMDLNIQDCPRDWLWWLEGKDLYNDNIEKFGFKQVYEPRRGDMCYMQIKSQVPNHAGIYLGNNLLFHHPSSNHGFSPTHMSVIEPITRWQKYIVKWIRYVENH